MLSRIGKEERIKCAEGISGTSLPPEMAEDVIETMLTALGARIQTSYECKQTAVASKSGMLEFAQTGRLSDHLVWLPSFDKAEIRCCLEYIRDRNQDENDPYKLYITKKEILNNGYIFVGYKNAGVFIEFSKAAYTVSPTQNLYIKNKMFADVIYDYVETHIPESHAITKDETTEYLNWLIDTCC